MTEEQDLADRLGIKVDLDEVREELAGAVMAAAFGNRDEIAKNGPINIKFCDTCKNILKSRVGLTEKERQLNPVSFCDACFVRPKLMLDYIAAGNYPVARYWASAAANADIEFIAEAIESRDIR